MDQIDKRAFGYLLETAMRREFPGESAAAVADKLGYTRARFWKWVSGKSMPSAATLPAVLTFFKIPAEDFINLPIEKKNS